jgi:hypothetical protein
MIFLQTSNYSAIIPPHIILLSTNSTAKQFYLTKGAGADTMGFAGAAGYLRREINGERR